MIEQRVSDDLCKEAILDSNQEYLEGCKKYQLPYHIIDDQYDSDEFIKSILTQIHN